MKQPNHRHTWTRKFCQLLETRRTTSLQHLSPAASHAVRSKPTPWESKPSNLAGAAHRTVARRTDHLRARRLKTRKESNCSATAYLPPALHVYMILCSTNRICSWKAGSSRTKRCPGCSSNTRRATRPRSGTALGTSSAAPPSLRAWQTRQQAVCVHTKCTHGACSPAVRVVILMEVYASTDTSRAYSE